MGYLLWDFEELGRHTRAPILRVFIDRENGVGVEDCARVNLALRKITDLDNLMGGDYQLEVSSPGVFRELKRPEHFRRFVGSRVRVLVRGFPPFVGFLRSYDPSLIVIESNGITHFIPTRMASTVNAEPILQVK